MPPSSRPRTEPDAEGIADSSPPAKVKARFVGPDPVLAVVDGEQFIVEPGDPIMVSAEQLEQDPVFVPWEG